MPAKAGIYQITVIPAVVGGYPSSGLDVRLRGHDEEIENREFLSRFPHPHAGIDKIFFLLIIHPDHAFYPQWLKMIMITLPRGFWRMDTP